MSAAARLIVEDQNCHLPVLRVWMALWNRTRGCGKARSALSNALQDSVAPGHKDSQAARFATGSGQNSTRMSRTRALFTLSTILVANRTLRNLESVSSSGWTSVPDSIAMISEDRWDSELTANSKRSAEAVRALQNVREFGCLTKIMVRLERFRFKGCGKVVQRSLTRVHQALDCTNIDGRGDL